MRVCVVYDFFYPLTVGGAERWYRELAERLTEAGHEVTYVTLRQWEPEDFEPAPFRVVALGPRMQLYDQRRRRILPGVVYGARVFLHLAVRGRRYDAVHSGSMPFFSLLAAAALRRFGGYRLVVDWIEVWTREYWREYLGRVGGEIGWRVQRLCARTRHRAFCFAELHAERLRALGHRGEITVLRGLYGGGRRRAEEASSVVVFAGRHIPEKRVPALVPAIARARERVPELRCEIFGDGPERPDVLRLIDEHALDGAVVAPGFVEGGRVQEAIAHALCLVLPSRREGYGLVVVEAAAAGTPSVVVAGPDNAAVELVEEGRNGFVAPSADPEDLAAALLRVHEAGAALRASTAEWYEENERRLSIETSLERVLAAYERG